MDATIKLSPTCDKALDKLVKLTGMSKSVLVNNAIEHSLAYYEEIAELDSLVEGYRNGTEQYVTLEELDKELGL